MKKKGILFVISGPSGSGKSTVIKEFLKKRKKDFVLSVSATTRAPRIKEKNKKDYYFLSAKEFKTGIKKGKFLEHAKVLGNLYGTLKATVTKSVKKGKNVIMDVDVQGARQLKRKKWPCVSVFIIPPSFKDLAKRLRKRKTDSSKSIDKRLALAKKELKERKKYDYIVMNKELNEAKKCLEYIFKLEKFKRYKI